VAAAANVGHDRLEIELEALREGRGAFIGVRKSCPEVGYLLLGRDAFPGKLDKGARVMLVPK
jgi:hypothetical protein